MGTETDWKSLVKRANPKREKEDRETPVYEFSNGRKFRTTDHTESGIYRPPSEEDE